MRGRILVTFSDEETKAIDLETKDAMPSPAALSILESQGGTHYHTSLEQLVSSLVKAYGKPQTQEILERIEVTAQSCSEFDRQHNMRLGHSVGVMLDDLENINRSVLGAYRPTNLAPASEAWDSLLATLDRTLAQRTPSALSGKGNHLKDRRLVVG